MMCLSCLLCHGSRLSSIMGFQTSKRTKPRRNSSKCWLASSMGNTIKHSAFIVDLGSIFEGQCMSWTKNNCGGALLQHSNSPFTLPETNSSPPKINGWMIQFPLGMAYFQRLWLIISFDPCLAEFHHKHKYIIWALLERTNINGFGRILPSSHPLWLVLKG